MAKLCRFRDVSCGTLKITFNRSSTRPHVCLFIVHRDRKWPLDKFHRASYEIYPNLFSGLALTAQQIDKVTFELIRLVCICLILNTFLPVHILNINAFCKTIVTNKHPPPRIWQLLIKRHTELHYIKLG